MKGIQNGVSMSGGIGPMPQTHGVNRSPHLKLPLGSLVEMPLTPLKGSCIKSRRARCLRHFL